jgi:DNA-binding transcriptional MerR regulator
VTRNYRLDELALEAGVSPRTVRYYVQRGLLPAPEFRGKDTVYGRDHLLRLRAVKQLQGRHLPLDEIQARLASATASELQKIAENGGAPRGSPPTEPLAREPTATAQVYRLAPGVELWVRSGHDAETRALVGEILNRYAAARKDDHQ